MFSKISNLLLRDKLHIAKLRKISQSKANLSRKSFGYKKILSNCLAKLLQKSEMRKDIVIELSYKGFG